MEILGHIDLGGADSQLACPHCGVRIGGTSLVVPPESVADKGQWILCPRCAAILMLFFYPGPSIRIPGPADKEALRRLPNATQIQALQRQIELRICPND